MYFLASALSSPIINYGALSQNISNARVYLLYPGMFQFGVFVALTLMGLLAFKKGLLQRLIMLLTFIWPMIIILNFLLYGFVIEDQPRGEFVLSYLVVKGKISLMNAAEKSGYFRWPSLWLLEGIYADIVNLNPFITPVILMVPVYLLLGLSIVTLSRRFLPGSIFGPTFLTATVYAILNPYEIFALCPQMYALTLLIILLSVLLKQNLDFTNIVTISLFSISIITSHPLTSIVLVSVLSVMLASEMVKGAKKYRNIAPIMGYASVIMLFTTWNLNYKDFLNDILKEILQHSSKNLSIILPLLQRKIYNADYFYWLMQLYQYSSTLFLAMFAFLSLILMARQDISRKKLTSLLAFLGVMGGSIVIIAFGIFSPRAIIFLTPMASALTFYGIEKIVYLLGEFGRFRRFLLLIKVAGLFIILFIPILSHVNMIEYLTTRSFVNTITSVYESRLYEFLAQRCDFHNPVWASYGDFPIIFPYYICIYNFNKSWAVSSRWIEEKIVELYQMNTSPSVETLAKNIYVGEIFIVSPIEKFVVYTYTLFNDWHLVDDYLSLNYNLLYTNKLFKVYAHK
ncbi:MAG: hypothetical protein QXE05_06020 [Nitrososphaeria archaeon]